MRDQRSLILLVVLAFVFIFGWQQFMAWMWPPAPRPKPDAAKQTTEAFAKVTPHQSALAIRSAGASLQADLPPLGGPAHVAAAVHLANPAVQARFENDLVRRIAEQVSAPNPVLSGPLRAGLLVTNAASVRDDLRQRLYREVASRNLVQRAAAARRLITLGDDSTTLKVELTTLGAGVQSVTLNEFFAADRYGRKQAERLRLIPEDATGRKLPPAFLLFHFQPGPDNPNDRPWDTLGTIDWRLEEESIKKVKTEQGEQVTEVAFTAEVPDQDVVLRKTYSLAPGDYHIGLSIRIQRKSGGDGPVQFRYQMTGGHALPIEGEYYTGTFRNSLIGQVDSRNNLWREYEESRSVSIKQGGKRVDKHPERFIRYAAVAVQYFASAIVVDSDQKEQDFLQWARTTLPWTDYQTNEKRPFLDDITVRVNTRLLDLKPDAAIEHKYLLYHGPMKVALLGELGTGSKRASPELVTRYKDKLRLDTLTDYHYQMEGFPGAMSRFFSAIYWTNVLIACTNLMHWVLNALHSVIPNYGVCIILLTVLVRVIMFPISRKQAMMSVRMQALAPEMKKVQEKYKDDPQGKSQAVMELYRKHGVNPLGSCWVMLLQMPVFMGLYYALMESIHFRLAEFWPLWINNLAAPDMLIWWGENIPLISNPEHKDMILCGLVPNLFYLGPYFNLLPIAAIALMVVHQKLFTPPPADEQQEMQMKMMKYMMLFMGVLFFKVAAGLALYFIMSSAWGLAERRFLPKSKIGEAAGGTGDGQAAKPVKPATPPKTKQKTEKTKKEKDGALRKVQDWWEEILRQAKKK
jgi:YidC/Oxa1 family membrane protein insertase